MGLIALEAITVGVAFNLKQILKLPNPEGFIRDRIKALWKSGKLSKVSGAGIRGTQRIVTTVPLGKEWFKPTE